MKNRLTNNLFPVLAAVILLAGCEDEKSKSPDLFLSGTYSLTDLSINVVGVSNVDTSVVFLTPVNGDSSADVAKNAVILDQTTDYSGQDVSPIGGTIALDNDGNASLEGFLPINFGSRCDPLIYVTALGPVVGNWESDISDYSFSIDMIIEQLSIDGYYSFDSTTSQLTVTYSATEPLDTLGISTVYYNDTLVPINKICWPATTTTTRIMKLIKQD